VAGDGDDVAADELPGVAELGVDDVRGAAAQQHQREHERDDRNQHRYAQAGPAIQHQLSLCAAGRRSASPELISDSRSPCGGWVG
jgi:hypothetical protein